MTKLLVTTLEAVEIKDVELPKLNFYELTISGSGWPEKGLTENLIVEATGPDQAKKAILIHSRKFNYIPDFIGEPSKLSGKTNNFMEFVNDYAHNDATAYTVHFFDGRMLRIEPFKIED